MSLQVEEMFKLHLLKTMKNGATTFLRYTLSTCLVYNGKT